MDKKYELLKDDYIKNMGKTLYKIKALKDFGNIEAGELGGYIQSENNLSHEGNCWVYDNAKVYEDAKICENAKVFGDAEVFGDAKVYGNVEVCGEAWVYEDARVYGNAKVFGDASICEDAQVYGDARVYGNIEVYGDARVCGNAKVFGDARVYGDARVCGNAEIYGHARVYGNTFINKGIIIGRVSMPYKDIFQHQCCKRVLTAILTENDEILYSIACQENITKEEFLDRIHYEDGGLKENPYRDEYLRLIPLIKLYFKAE